MKKDNSPDPRLPWAAGRGEVRKVRNSGEKSLEKLEICLPKINRFDNWRRHRRTAMQLVRPKADANRFLASVHCTQVNVETVLVRFFSTPAAGGQVLMSVHAQICVMRSRLPSRRLRFQGSRTWSGQIDRGVSTKALQSARA